jgi:H+/Cl- antiporter ClcA
MALAYDRIGGHASRGTNLVIDEIHQPTLGVPRRMAPLILLATVGTHLFGGSAGREGTAVQMGGSLAAAWARSLRLSAEETSSLLLCGVAAGFGGVFGTPLAGTVFALEFLAVGKFRAGALAPCLVAAVVADATTRGWGIAHEHYVIAPLAMTALMTFKLCVAAALFGGVAALFVWMTHAVEAVLKRGVKVSWLRPAVGGLVVIGLVLLLGTRDYLGLGTLAEHAHAVTIQTCFAADGARWSSWWWKVVFTAVTLGSGFKGGEVTPLFFMGAAAGNTLALLLQAPVAAFAAIGLAAVFGAASNTPLACTILGIELFGAGLAVPLAIACLIAVAFSGTRSIYASQKRGILSG